jgi:hypothetical protein
MLRKGRNLPFEFPRSLVIVTAAFCNERDRDWNRDRVGKLHFRPLNQRQISTTRVILSD